MSPADVAPVVLEAPARAPRTRPLRFFFVGMAAFAVAILMSSFVPEYQRYAAGAFPIAWVLHVHAAIMFAWVAGYVLQAYLGATGQTVSHRALGRYAVATGWLAWASMVYVELRTFVAHPTFTEPSDLDWKLPGVFIYLTFAVFLGWAVRERRRPQWHKRLMTFALFLSLDAAIQRYLWVPRDYGFAPFMALLDVSLLVPLIAYDLRTFGGRLHPATIRGALIVLVCEASLLALWGTALWHRWALAMGALLRG